MPQPEQPNFDDEFERAVATWRERHKLREDDAVLLLVELFRIHQRHWDELRRREMPSLELLRTDLAKHSETARTSQGQSAALLELLRKLPSTHLSAHEPRTQRVPQFSHASRATESQ